MLKNFLGNSPLWLKYTILSFLVFNVFANFLLGPTVTAWIFIAEFIFCLAMALKCYPLQTGGLLALEILILKLTSPEAAKEEVIQNFEVIFLLMFMVAGIYFMKPLLMFIFSKVFTKIKSKLFLSLLFLILAAVLSAFLDALTVTAVLISVAVGFYGVYHRIQSANTDYNDSGVLDRKEFFLDRKKKFQTVL